MKKIARYIDKLPPKQIGKYEQLQEWLDDLDDKEIKIAIFNIYMDYSLLQISPFKHNELFAEASKTLKQRGDEATGWILGMENMFLGRILNEVYALTILSKMIKLYLRKNQLINIPKDLLSLIYMTN